MKWICLLYKEKIKVTIIRLKYCYSNKTLLVNLIKQQQQQEKGKQT